MEKIKLTPKDKKYLLEIGYLDEDIEQISRTSFEFEYLPKKGRNYSIDSSAAIRIVGRKPFVSCLARATFHWSAVRTNDRCTKAIFIENAD